MERRDILVFVEQAGGGAAGPGLEALAPARQLADAAGGRVLALLAGADNAAAAQKAAVLADEVLSVEGPAFGEGCFDAAVCALQAAMERYAPAALLAGGGAAGRELTARLAARLGAACLQDVTALEPKEDGLHCTAALYGGTVLGEFCLAAQPWVFTVRPGAFSRPAAGAAGPVTPFLVEPPAQALRAQVAEAVREIAESVDLQAAKVIVTGGRGMGSAEGFALVRQLAELLGGVPGATRPAIEAGWISRAHQVGQSGKIVAPPLYIACGVSGATQHVSGMSGAGYVVAINKDEDAPIFEVADLGIVGDALQVLPVMIEEIKKRQAG